MKSKLTLAVKIMGTTVAGAAVTRYFLQNADFSTIIEEGQAYNIYKSLKPEVTVDDYRQAPPVHLRKAKAVAFMFWK